MSSSRFLRALLAVALTGTAAVVAAAGPAQAAGPRPHFQLPFKCGDTWRLATYAGHDNYDIDMTATSGVTEGRPILASYDGTVAYAGWDNGGGWYVKLNHGGGWQTLYLHMKQSPSVSTGQSVKRGQQLGIVGSTGDSSGPHLHYEQLRDGAKTESYFNGQASGIRDDSHSYSVTRTSFNCGSTVSVYGAFADGRLSYTAVSPDTGDRTHGAMVSTATLGFAPKALATLNFNTLLVTSTAGALYRVDVITNNNSLSFNPPVYLGGGWTHDLLTYDGSGSLFGIAGGVLRRYTVNAAKPGAGNITGNTQIGTGFALKTLASGGPDRIVGTTSSGLLLSYRIRGAGDWSRYELRSSTWQVFDHLVSPGAGLILAHQPSGALLRYLDTDPYDGAGDDILRMSDVDAGGWTQTLLSAQPFAL
jgi:murein DD-endopeptidase MepM/ murein hydrolase activator NlpD